LAKPFLRGGAALASGGLLRQQIGDGDRRSGGVQRSDGVAAAEDGLGDVTGSARVAIDLEFFRGQVDEPVLGDAIPRVGDQLATPIKGQRRFRHFYEQQDRRRMSAQIVTGSPGDDREIRFRFRHVVQGNGKLAADVMVGSEGSLNGLGHYPADGRVTAPLGTHLPDLPIEQLDAVFWPEAARIHNAIVSRAGPAVPSNGG